MTSRLTYRPFRSHDLALLGELSDSMVGMGLLHHEATYGKKLEDAGPCYSAFDGEELVGCGGIGLMWNGVGGAWLILASSVSRFPLSLHRWCSRFLDKMILEHHLHRVQTEIPYDHPRSERWIERLKFRYEGLMPCYGPDRSWFKRYARITV